jgi:protein-disulfide isomerase
VSKLSVPVSSEDYKQGGEDAECVLVEYGDYECPHCRAAQPVVKQLERHFGKRLMFVFRSFPLTQIHPMAEPAAETAEFAGAHGLFWEMHDLLLENQDQLGLPLFQTLAKVLGLDPAKLTADLEQNTYRKKVRADFAGGVRSGVNGTPTFFINGRRYNGPNEYPDLLEAIKETLG